MWAVTASQPAGEGVRTAHLPPDPTVLSATAKSHTEAVPLSSSRLAMLTEQKMAVGSRLPPEDPTHVCCQVRAADREPKRCLALRWTLL